MNETTLAGTKPDAGLPAEPDTLEALQQRFTETLHQLIAEKERLFSTMVCEAVLGVGNTDENLFTLPEKKKPNGEDQRLYSRIYGDLALIFLNRLQGKKVDLTSEFISLRDYVAANTGDPSAYALDYVDGYTVSLYDRIVSIFFQQNGDKLGYALLYACELVYHGIPLYMKNGEGKFEAVPFSNEDYVYLSQKGRLSDTHGTATLPEWANTYFIRKQHLDAHAIFFNATYADRQEDAVKALRSAFRRHIGCDEPSPTPAAASATVAACNHPSRLWEIAHDVIKRYYGATFDINNRDTWPRQDDVVAWIKKTYAGVEQRPALAIDVVTRPDRLK